MTTEQEVRAAFPHIDPSTAAKIAEVANENGIENIDQLKTAVDKAVKALRYVCDIIREVGEQISYTYNAILRAVATPREWHLMHHAKRRRTRKKYENRIARRTKALIGGRCT